LSFRPSSCSRQTRRIIWQNFAGTIAVDTAGICVAAVGLLNPTLAAFIHVASEIIFILNSARFLPSSYRARANAESARDPALERAGKTAQQKSEVCAFR
jgi:hypothetical protein